MKNLFAATTIALTLLSTSAYAAQQSAKIAVGELSCPTCVFIVSSSIKAVPTVKVVNFVEGENWWEGVFTVSYDDAVATPEMIADSVLSNGYPALVVSGPGS